MTTKRRKPRPDHAASPARSKRLQRLLEILRSRRELSSLQLIRRAGIVALSATVDELRKAGHAIDCARRDGVWFYRYRGRA